MKKVLIVLCISAILAACNGNSTKSTDVKTDSITTVNTDTTTKMAPDTTTKMAPDTAKAPK